MAGFRNSQKLVAGVAEVLYTVPAGKSATVSVQALNANGFILAAQQNAISVNPLISTVGTNTANISAVLGTTYWTGAGQPNAFNTSNGSNTATGMNIYTLGANGFTVAAVNSANIYSEIHLDYRVPLRPEILAYDSYFGGVRAIQFDTSTYPLPTLYTRSSFTGATAASATSYTKGTGCSSILNYLGKGAVSHNGFVIGMDNGYYSVAYGYNGSGSGAVIDVTSSDASGNTNVLDSLRNGAGYTFGNNTFSLCYNASTNIGLFIGGYKSADLPAIFTIRTSTSAFNAANTWCRFYLSGPANGTCPLWLRYFGVNWYVGMSDGTVWKWANATRDPFPGSSTTATITCTQVTLPAGISINRRPVVVSATEMHFGSATSPGFPFVMNTSDVFTAYPNATYPTELSFASATVANPKLILKYGSTVNDYTIVDTSSVYKTVANYSALDADSYLFNGYTGSFERTGIVLASGDKLIAAEPGDNDCVVQVYGYEED